jgi:hypothetical protein
MTVPNLWDKTPATPSPSELNPLTNPVLEQNLSRWARIYFSNPPAKREQAVNQLLEEIKRESGSAQPGRPYFATDVKFQRAVCAACQHQNPPGHKFCSRCGQTLSPAQPGPTEHLGTNRIRETLPPNFTNDMPWLSDRAFSGLDDSDSRRKRGWKYLVGAAVLVLTGFAYMQWAPGSLTRLVSSPAPRVSAPEAALPPEVRSPAEAKVPAETIVPESVVPKSVAPESVAPEPRSREAKDPSVTAEARDQAATPTGIQSAAQKAPLLDATSSHQTLTDQGNSAPDVRLAQRYLGGSMGVRDPSEAAKLLWKAVSKQNATAAVLLSDLYLRGDGVPRSCDQARLLLIAAAKRGSPLAAQQLRNLESQGCQ